MGFKSAVDKINKELSIETVMNHYQFKSIVGQGEILRACCEVHGGHNPSSFVANTDTNMWYCHSCGEYGDTINLIQKIDDVSFPKAVEFIKEEFNIDLDNLELVESKSAKRAQKQLDDWVKMIARKKKKSQPKIKEFSFKEEVKEVTDYRDFCESTLKYFNFGFVDKIELEKRTAGTYISRNRYIVPIIFNNVQVGVSLRRQNEEDNPKWIHAPSNLNTGDCIYNYDNVKKEPVIAVCEGPFDVWACHEAGIPACAMFGSHVTDEQFRLLLNTYSSIVFMFDSDEAGLKAQETAKEKFKNKADIFTVDLGKGNDPSSISREELKIAFVNKRRL